MFREQLHIWKVTGKAIAAEIHSSSIFTGASVVSLTREGKGGMMEHWQRG